MSTKLQVLDGGKRVLALDQVEEVEVRLPGRIYTLRQDRRAMIERVLGTVAAVEENGRPEPVAEGDGEVKVSETDKQYVSRIFGIFEKCIHIFPLIFGFEDESADDFKLCLTHLTENLTADKAAQIYEAWWDLNRIGDFFVREGNVLLPPEVVNRILGLRNAAQELASETA
jgi:hypothetical protein